MARFPIQIEIGRPGPSPADVLPNALAFVRFLNGINLGLMLIGGIWWAVSDSIGEALFFVGAGVMATSTWILVIAVKLHNGRVRRDEERKAAAEALRRLDSGGWREARLAGAIAQLSLPHDVQRLAREIRHPELSPT